MNVTLKIFLIIFLLFVMFILIKTLKRKRMSIRYVIVWLFILIILFIFTIFPSILMSVANFFGFEAASNMVFLLGYFLLFYLVFNQTIEISKQKKEIVQLIQELSILKKDINDGKKR